MDIQYAQEFRVSFDQRGSRVWVPASKTKQALLDGFGTVVKNTARIYRTAKAAQKVADALNTRWNDSDAQVTQDDGAVIWDGRY